MPRFLLQNEYFSSYRQKNTIFKFLSPCGIVDGRNHRQITSALSVTMGSSYEQGLAYWHILL